jgi:hypothetical protein
MDARLARELLKLYSHFGVKRLTMSSRSVMVDKLKGDPGAQARGIRLAIMPASPEETAFVAYMLTDRRKTFRQKRGNWLASNARPEEVRGFVVIREGL